MTDQATAEIHRLPNTDQWLGANSDRLADAVEKLREPVEHLQPAYDAMVQKSNDLAEDIKVRRASIDAQLEDIKALDRDYEARRAEMVERYDAERAELASQTDAQTVIRQSIVDMAAHFKAKPEAPKPVKPKAPAKPRTAKGKVREAAE